MIAERWPARTFAPALSARTAVAVAALGGIVGALPPTYATALVATSAALVVAVASPVLALGLLVIVIPLSPASGAPGGLPIAVPDALGAVILAATALAGLARRHFTLTLTRAFWPGVAFLLAVLFSAFFAPDLVLSAKELIRWGEALGLLVVGASLCQAMDRRRLVVVALLLGLVAESLVGWVQFLLRRGPEGFRIGAFLRAYGTFGQPNPFGGYLVMTLPVALGIVLWAYGAWRLGGHRSTTPAALVLVASGTGVVGVVALLMSLSRGALLGLVVAGVVLLSLFTRRGLAFLGAGVLVLLLLLLLDSTRLIPAVVSQRIAQIWEFVGWFDAAKVAPTPENWAVVERMAHWQAAWNMYITHPITGIGPGNYANAYPLYRVNDFWLDPLGHAHDLYLNVMAELGFPGIVTYVAQWIAWLAVSGAAFLRSRGSFDRGLAAGVIASLVGVAIHNIFDNLSVHGLATEAGLLVGLCAAIRRPAPEVIVE